MFDLGENKKMIAFREILINVKGCTDNEIEELLKSFCNSLNSYEFIDKKSEDYSRNVNGGGYIIYSLRTPDTEPAAIAIAEKTERSLYVSNIVPKEKSKLSMSEYNAIALKFYNDFKPFLRRLKNSVNLSISNETIGLDIIIPGKKTRQYFERYIAAYPLSFHPIDIERLDFFICALKKYRSKVDLQYLKGYLIGDLSWNEKDARWCIDRIETGLNILEANMKFHYN